MQTAITENDGIDGNQREPVKEVLPGTAQTVSTMTTTKSIKTVAAVKREKGVIWYDLLNEKKDTTLEDKVIMDLENQTLRDFDDDKPVDHPPEWLQQSCHDIMRDCVWPGLKLLGDRPVYELRANRIIALFFHKLGWHGDDVSSKENRRRYWRSIERYIIYWLTVTNRKVAKNVRNELEKTGK